MQTIQIGKKISIKLLFSISKAVSLKQLALPARVNLIKQADIGRPFWVSNRRTSLHVTLVPICTLYSTPNHPGGTVYTGLRGL
jgi:hypothetical protein